MHKKTMADIDITGIDKEAPHDCPVCGAWVNASHQRKAVTCGRTCGAVLRTLPRVTPESKVCSRCRVDRPIDNYGLDKNRVDGRNGMCKQCLSKYRSTRTHKQRDSRLRWTYGISHEEWDRMYLRQKRRCMICRKRKLKSGMYVDHCHATGAVRGLLCPTCNWGLGQFKDDTKLLRNAIKYLEASRSSAAST